MQQHDTIVIADLPLEARKGDPVHMWLMELEERESRFWTSFWTAFWVLASQDRGDDVEYRRWLLGWVEGMTIRLGIDLEKRGHEVRKLLYKGFAGLMHAQRYDPEEVLQDVYRGILTRNRGKCPWDPRKSTFGHYVHMVIGCILKNFHRKEQTRIQKIPVSTDEVDVIGTEPDTDLMGPMEALRGYLGRVGAEDPLLQPSLSCLPLMVAGYTQAQMAETLGLSKHVVSKSVHWIKSCAQEWMA